MDFDLDRHFPFSEVSKTLQRLSMYPYLDLSHYILMCLLVKEDTPQLGSPVFSRKHPFASWLASMLMCFAGTIIGNALIGDALIAPFQNHRDLLLASAVWYIINYAPFDLAYKMAKFAPINLIICLVKEVQRARKVHDGVVAGVKLFPQAYLLNVLVGLVKGAGSAEMKLFERMIRGVWLPAVSEHLRPTATTKACLVAAAVFLLEHVGILAPQHHHHVYLGVVGFFVLLRLSAKLLGIADPFAPLESLTCAIFFGGLADALNLVLRRGGATAARPGTLGTATGVGEHAGASAAGAVNGAAAKSPMDKKME